MAKSTNTKKVLMIINIVLLLGLAGSTAYLFLKNRDLNDQITLTNEEKNSRLIAEINKVYDLPDEEPTIGVVKDVGEFKKEFPAFANDDVKVDDNLLFFRKARLNVLYRSSEKRVVKTANVSLPIAVEIFGSEEAIKLAEEKLKDFGNQITITKKITDGITQAFVFDVDNDQADETRSIATQLSYDVGSTLPSAISPSDLTEIIIAATENGTKTPAQSQSSIEEQLP